MGLQWDLCRLRAVTWESAEGGCRAGAPCSSSRMRSRPKELRNVDVCLLLHP